MWRRRLEEGRRQRTQENNRIKRPNQRKLESKIKLNKMGDPKNEKQRTVKKQVPLIRYLFVFISTISKAGAKCSH